jgi:HSP20 family protein
MSFFILIFLIKTQFISHIVLIIQLEKYLNDRIYQSKKNKNIMKFLNLNPAREFFIENSVPSQFFNTVDSVFQNQLKKYETDYQFSPKVDITEDENHFTLHVHLPGIKKENVNVEIIKNTLVISGERTFKKENDTRKFQSIESFEGKFKRSFKLNENIDKSQIEAKMEDGILTIELKKAENKVEKTAVTIK